jgi:hypothetical protein
MIQPFPRAVTLAATPLVLFALALTGCASKDIQGVLVPNQRPTVELTNAPVEADRSSPYFYAYKLNWSGNDPDGRIDHYKYAVDPTATDTVWIRSDRNEETVFFRASQPDPVKGTAPATASDFHVFVIKAVDDDGAESPRKSRAFFSYTIAPSLLIRNPIPSKFLRAQIPPSVRIEWEGSDVDGQFTQKPVKYKYRMLDLDDPANSIFLSDPDSLRKLESATNWAGWDSTSAETTFVQFTNLTPGKSYLFALIGFDEAGAYSPIFSLDSNLLQMSATLAASNGPRIRIYNEFIDFTYESGGYTTDPLREINIEIPTGVPINVNWEALPPQGSRIQHFRWMVDGNINDETDRPDEQNDYQYWSREDPTMPNGVRLRPFTEGEHRFYLECTDNNTQKSLGILKMTAVTPTFDKTLIVVNDTRLEVDKFLGDPVNRRIPDLYTKPWPSKTELDTFLFARGGVPWTGTKNPTTGVLSRPGVMAGYDMELSRRLRLPDTLGTRLGLENPARGVLLSRIGQYRSLIWMVDDVGGQYIESIDQSIFPVTALYSMSGPGRASTLAAYTQLGGRVWLMGGGAGFASLRSYDVGNNNVGQTTVFTTNSIQGRPPELGPARIMYDGAHWRSSIAVSKGDVRTYRYEYWVRFLRPNGTLDSTLHVVKPAWSHVARGEMLASPAYSKLPAQMRARAETNDPVPPTRLASQGSLFYITSYPVEYIHSPNFILEDVDPDPEVVNEASVLDTLFEAESIILLTRRTGLPDGALNRAPQMTYYHGNEARQFVFSGLAPWNYVREDCIAMFDFVLQDIWGLTRQPIDRGIAAPALQRNAQPVRRAAPLERSPGATTVSATLRE